MSHQIPGKQAPLFAVCYDLSDDRERRRISKLLLGFGFRVQKSVFECHLTPGAHRNLLRQLENQPLKSGHVRLYRVYAGGAQTCIGAAQEHPDHSHAYIVLPP